MKNEKIKWVIWTVFAVVVTLALKVFVVETYYSKVALTIPAVKAGEYFVVTKIFNLSVGDTVIFSCKRESDKTWFLFTEECSGLLVGIRKRMVTIQRDSETFSIRKKAITGKVVF